MEQQVALGPGVTVALALAAGIIATSLARHLKLPGIVVLLGAGVLLGPDVANLVRPGTLGPALHILVGFAVAVVLFEGGLNLNFSRLRREAKIIRRLLTVGALVTAIGGTLAARLIMGWDWRPAVLFGTLVIVTGPTVITPLLRRIKVKRNIETILEAEGVLIDAIGAVLAVVVLQVVISPTGQSFAMGVPDLFARLGFGAIAGVLAGFVLALLLRLRHVVPDGLENVFTLTLVLALFQLSNAVMPQSGVMTVTAAGLVVGNVKTRVQRDLLEFKEQLTVMLIGMLFVLLAADVRVEDVSGLGTRGIATVLCLMLLVRPLNIFLSTRGSDLTFKEKAFLSWLAPRGIVAAAIASLFAHTLETTGIPGGPEMRALVFMLIAVTVLVQGLSGGLVAQLLGLRRPAGKGYAFLGASELAHALGRILRDAGEDVLFMDTNPNACRAVEQDGFRVIYGNAIEERVLQRAQIEDLACCVAITTSEDANMLFAQKVQEYKIPQLYVALRRGQSTVDTSLVQEHHAEVLFGARRDLELWALRFRRDLAQVEPWIIEINPKQTEEEEEQALFQAPENLVLPLARVRSGKIVPVHTGLKLKKGDVVYFGLFAERLEEASNWLADRGWMPHEEQPAEEEQAEEEQPADETPETGSGAPDVQSV